MKKIFPFYKGKNIANNPLGYASERNARNRLKREEINNDFLETLPEDYWLDHYKVYELENPWNKSIQPERYGISMSGFQYGITVYTRGYIDKKSEKYIKQLPDDIYSLFLELYRLEPLVTEDYYAHKTTHKEEYKNLIYTILEKGYFPHLWKDERDYKKRYARFITDNVEFREMEVTISAK